MKVLSRYLIREFLKFLILCQIIFLSIYLIFDSLLKIDNFIEADVSVNIMLLYFLYKAPFVMVQMLPPAILISVIIMFSLMKKKNEFTAMKACGLDILKVSKPIIMISLLGGVALFLFSETVVPYTSSKFNEIWDIEVEKRDPTQFYGMNQIWYKGSNSIFWMLHFDYKNQIMERPTFYFFDDSFRLIKRIDGRWAIWKKGKWKVEDGIIQEVNDKGEYQSKKFDDLYLELDETPEAFIRRVKSPEEMSYWQLKRYAERVIMEGYDNTRYLVDLNFKIAFPFIIIIMILIGMPISLRVEKGGIPVAILLGISICFLYMVALLYARTLGFSGILPPILSAWAANIIFLLVGIYLMMHITR